MDIECGERVVECDEQPIVVWRCIRLLTGIGVTSLQHRPKTPTPANAIIERGAGDCAQPCQEDRLLIAGSRVAGDAEIGLLERFAGEVVIAAGGGEKLAKEPRAEHPVEFEPRRVVAPGKCGGELAQRRERSRIVHALGRQRKGRS